jgi:hypothetical protein
MLDVSYVVETIPEITTDVLSAKSYKQIITTTLSETIHSSCTNQRYPTSTTRNSLYSNNQAKFLFAHKYIARATHKSKLLVNQ